MLLSWEILDQKSCWFIWIPAWSRIRLPFSMFWKMFCWQFSISEIEKFRGLCRFLGRASIFKDWVSWGNFSVIFGFILNLNGLIVSCCFFFSSFFGFWSGIEPQFWAFSKSCFNLPCLLVTFTGELILFD